MRKDELRFEFSRGLHDAGDTVAVPAGALLAGSQDVLYTKTGKLISFKDLLGVGSTGSGGSRMFSLDADLHGVMGINDTTTKAVGNMLQGPNRSLWFVGNTIADASAVRVVEELVTVTNIGALSSTPQLAKYNGSGWDSPVQVGLAPQDTAPELILTTDATRDALFSGLLTGSLSLRIARKRGGAISIASGASNVVTADGDSVYATIPDYTEDGSDQDDRIWLLYLTITGFGSQAAHQLFPIEIPESKLDGTDPSGWSSVQGNAKVKVISQHASTQASRKIEIEYNNNDLLLINPFEDYYPAESCKYLAQLGNVMCLIGTGDDSTGFDVSYPNNREAYSPDWRDWFSEVPVSICHNPESSTFWVMGANTTYQARWTGNTQESAPVVISQASAKYGSIGEGASVSINGVLYMLSKGKTPVRIDSNRNVDDQFGMRVKDAFATFDERTQIGWFEDYNLVVFICDKNTIAYQIDNDIWTAECGLTVDTGSIDGCFSMNGKLYVANYDSVGFIPSYVLSEYHAGTGGNWTIISSFQAGQYSLALKDIIELRTVVEVEDQPATIDYGACKNFTPSLVDSLASQTITSTGVTISARLLTEALDYDTIAVVVGGDAGGQSVFAVSVIVDVHSIERGN